MINASLNSLLAPAGNISDDVLYYRANVNTHLLYYLLEQTSKGPYSSDKLLHIKRLLVEKFTKAFEHNNLDLTIVIKQYDDTTLNIYLYKNKKYERTFFYDDLSKLDDVVKSIDIFVKEKL